MNVGVPRELKPGEGRVAMTPDGVRELVMCGVEAAVESGAGLLSGFSNESYLAAGATVCAAAAEVWDRSELIVKVKEILLEEIPFIRPFHTIFTFFHAPLHIEMSRGLLDSGCTAIDYEEVTLADGTRPLLRPMSEIAGKLGFVKAIEHMQSIRGGSGRLPIRVEGVEPLHVMIIGPGVAGTAVTELALALGNVCHVIGVNAERRRRIKGLFPAIHVYENRHETIARLLPEMDIVVNALAGYWAPDTHLITRAMVRTMKPSAFIVDLSCDPVGGIETCRPTSHDDPVYVDEGIPHYCVDNIPGAVPVTATRSLCAASFPYVKELAMRGVASAASLDPGLAHGVIFSRGEATHRDSAAALGLVARDPLETLAGAVLQRL